MPKILPSVIAPTLQARSGLRLRAIFFGIDEKTVIIGLFYSSPVMFSYLLLPQIFCFLGALKNSYAMMITQRFCHYHCCVFFFISLIVGRKFDKRNAY